MDSMAHKFNPNGAATSDSGVFGLPHGFEESELILLPVPWEATVSYGTGTVSGPEAIFEASKFVELYDPDLKDFYLRGIHFTKNHLKKFKSLNDNARKEAEKILAFDGKIFLSNVQKARLRKQKKIVNDYCMQMNDLVYREVSHGHEAGKHVGVIGGDHSIAYGSIKAHLDKYPDMTVLQIDAHCDLRKSFENFEFSHASVMYNALTKTNLSRLVQVGIRGLCDEEYKRISENKKRISTFFQNDLHEKMMGGKSWKMICNQIISTLGKNVYISFDIDGLDATLCPNAGTPVPGGLSFAEAIYLIKQLMLSNRNIVGFDLVETSPSDLNLATDFNANIAANLLYKICGYCIRSWHS